MLKYYDFSGVSFLVEKSFECENASENATARFVQPGTLVDFVLIVRLLPSLVNSSENFKTKFCTIKYW